MAREQAQKPFHERIAEQLIEQLKEGRAPWQRPWGTDGGDYLPTNAATGKRYKGVNAIALMAQGHDDQRWLTYKQAEAMGAQVRKGEKGTGIIYWKFEDEQALKDAQGKPIKNDAGETMKMKVQLERPRPFYATVFNAEQIDGLPPLAAREARPFSQHGRAETIMANSGVKIIEAPGDRAYYRPATDEIRLPRRDQFTSEAGFYATALHELGHATGHASRLDRDLNGGFGSQKYAKEELRAEIASMIVGSELGTGHDPSHHVAYVASWIEVLTEQPLEIMRACADAEKIRDHVLGWEQQQSLAIGSGAASENTTAEQELAAFSLTANAGYDPLETWTNLRETANKNGLVATLERSREPDPEGTIAPYRVIYATAEGEPTTIITSMYSDGKALTMAQGERVPGTGYSADADWQSAALANAFTIDRTAAAEAKAALQTAEYQRLSIAAARAENALEIGASDGQCRHIAEAIVAKGMNDVELFGMTIAEDGHLTSDMAATAVLAIGRAPARSEEVYTAPRATAAATPEDSDNAVISTARAVAAATPEDSDSDAQTGRTYIKAPYGDRREVRDLGGEWDTDKKSWFVPPGVDAAPFARWQAPVVTAASEPVRTEQTGRAYIAVPFTEREEAKALGAKWDRAAKSWYAPGGAGPELATRWTVEKAGRQAPAPDPIDEFKQALKDIGCVVTGKHPTMDGQRHRIETEGDKKGEKSGFYIGYLDGHPAGYMINNRTGQGGDWKSHGYRLTAEERAKLQAESEAKIQDRQAARDATTEAVAARVAAELATLRPVESPTPYMLAKGIEPQPGVFTDTSGTRTLIPAYDIEGRHRTTQTITSDGTKLFAKDSQKEGCFHVIGGQDRLAAAPAIVIAEGYSTAATIANVLGYATVAAFDAGNLKPVAVALAEAYPDKPLIIAGDDDYRLQMKAPFVNRGAVAAKEAAEAAGGTAIIPILAQADRERGLSDFNDLETRAEQTNRGARRQIEPHVAYQIARKTAELDTARQERVETPELSRQQEREPRAIRIRG